MSSITPTTIKITAILNHMGQVVAASRHAGDTETSSGQVADLGQSLLELELPAAVAQMEGDKLLAHLSEHASVKSATAHLASAPASGQAITSGTL